MKAWKDYKEKIKHHLHEVLRTKTSSHSIALGFAVGTFISILPTPFINIPLAFLVILIYEKINKYSLFFAIIFWNPVTLAPFYFLIYKLGNAVFGTAPTMTIKLTLLEQAIQFTRRFFISSIIVGAASSIPIYYLVKKGVDVYREKYGS